MIDLAIKNGLNDVTTEEVNVSSFLLATILTKSFLDIFFLHLQVPHWVRGEETAEMVKPRFKKIAILGFGTSVSTPLQGIIANVIVVRSFEDLKTMNENQIRGNIVVFDPPFISYGNTVIYRTEGATRAAKKGAVATLVRSVTPFSLYTLHTGSQYYGENVTKIPTAAITHEDADLMRRLQNAGEEIKVTLKMFSTFDTKTSRNIILDVKGHQDPHKYVIVSGHIDSWDVGQGAMDDGGGMMISWFVPVMLKRFKFTPRRTLRSILWTAEEPGLIGAAAYLKGHENELMNITFIMESDEGTFEPLGLDIAGSPQTRCVIQEILKLFSPIDKITESGSPGSDITMFINKGVPGASLLNANERYYWYHHSEADTLSVQSEREMTHCAAFWTAVSFVIADLSIDIPR